MNGIKFDLTGSNVTINGRSASESDLRVGMIGTVIADIDIASSTAKAVSVEVFYNIAGTIDSIDLVHKNLVVAGQRVLFNSLTIFSNGSPETLKIGDRVAVSGLINTSNVTVAGYIDVSATPASNDDLVTGTISNVDFKLQKFRIGTLWVNFATAGFIDMVKSDLKVDLPVRIIGNRDTNGVLQARTVQNLASRKIGKQNDIVIMEGIANVDFFTNTITIGNNTMAITPQTEFVNGTQKDIYANSKLYVRGRITTPGTIAADRIEFPVSPNISIIGKVESVDVLQQRVIVSGLSITVTRFTRLLDVSTAQIRKFSLADVRIGDQLTVHGYQSESGTEAFLLRRDSISGSGTGGDSEVAIRGLTGTSVSDPYFDIGTTTVDTSTLTNAGSFLDRSGNPISRSAFFSSIIGGAFVEAQGKYASPILTASLAKLLGQGNMTVTGIDGGAITGVNDLIVFWDGSLNTEQDVANGTTVVNMFITSNTKILGNPWTVRDIRVFGPGNYSFDTCQYHPAPGACGVLTMTVGPNQVGAHMLLNWNFDTNISAVNVWDRNKAYCADTTNPSCSIYAISADGISITGLNMAHWNLVSTDPDRDGNPGVFLVDGSFRGAVAVNFNLVY